MRIAILFIGGMHQALHIAPVMATLAARDDSVVSAFVANTADAEALSSLMVRLGAKPPSMVIMALPFWLEWLVRLPLVQRTAKIMRIFWWSRGIRRNEAS
jgi:hypothetical protein